MSKERPLYKIDKDNNLAFKYPKDKSYRSIKGRFSADSSNRLVYEIDKEGNWSIIESLGRRIILEGEWKLNKDHDLVFYLRKERDRRRKSLKLRGKILKLDSESFLFEIKSKPDYKVTRVSYLKLRGVIGRDRFNRLLFQVTKKDSPDELIFRNSWLLNRSKEIIYNYSKLGLKVEQSLILRGYWDIRSDRKISYILEKSDSYVSFLANLESKSLYPKRGVIKYRVGVGFKDNREENLISFKGNWKLGKNKALIFEVDQGKGGIRRYYFSYTVKVSNRDRIILTVFNNSLEPLGINLSFRGGELDRDSFEYFLKVAAKDRERKVEIGFKRRI
ncbi:MAG: hypothetical protein P9L98_02530 [Candidatus Kaelpia imicola]|nr:hypothetical protein [Candidatus Kaelpia imicola]